MDIAIIGLSCKFPRVDNHIDFWEHLANKVSSISEVPEFRWRWQAYWGDPKTEINKSLSKWGGFINDVDAFDANFFGILPKVVSTMDPQQRIMLELAWACIEDAGIAPSRLRGKKIGVICGVFNHDYKEMQESRDFAIEAHHSTGTASSIIANRISHFFDFKGPSLPIDTACSSSLNAVHSAIQAIQYGDCELALAGGINLLLTPTRHISFAKMGMLSPTGSCKSFDDAADGYVRGEGAGLLLLKSLEQAVQEGDAVYAVIKGSAINHCGETYTLTYPSPDAQAEVIVAAHERAGVPINSISYIEAHGTGTPKGDPIEFQGLLKAFTSLADKQGVKLEAHQCAIGSVKSNVGHLEASAGIVSIIKVVLAMQYRRLPALQNFKKLNSRITIEDTPFYMLSETIDWLPAKCDDAQSPVPLRAGISSFGFGGTNAHVVLEDFIAANASDDIQKPAYFVALSAKTADTLLEIKKNLIKWLRDRGTQIRLVDLSAGLLMGREHFAVRCSYLIDSVQNLLAVLESEISRGKNHFNIIDTDDLDGRVLATGEANKKLHKLALNKAIRSKKQYLADMEMLLDLYVQGATPEWSILFEGVELTRLRLPTYPFKKERFWVTRNSTGVNSRVAQLHPLLQQNTSNLEQQRYSSFFSGDEFFLKDHQIQKNKIFPAAAYLEIANELIKQAVDFALDNDRLFSIEMRKVVFLRPFSVQGQARELRAHISPLRDNTGALAELQYPVHFEMVSGFEKSALEVNCRGEGFVRFLEHIPEMSFAKDIVDATWKNTDRDECYQSLTDLGFDYGPAHQVIEQLWLGSDGAVAKLVLADTVDQSFHLHPAVIDGALQAAVILLSEYHASQDLQKDPTKYRHTYLPFSIENMSIFTATQDVCWAHVRYLDRSQHKVAIDIFVEQPHKDKRIKLIAQIDGLMCRELKNTTENMDVSADVNKAAELVEGDQSYYSPSWQKKMLQVNNQPAPERVLMLGEAMLVKDLVLRLNSLHRFSATKFITVTYGDHYHKFGSEHYQLTSTCEEHFMFLADDLKKEGGAPEFITLPHLDIDLSGELDGALTREVCDVFLLVKSYFKLAKKARFISLVNSKQGEFKPLLQGLSGFYKTVKLEKPSFTGCVLLCDYAKRDDQSLGDIIASELLATAIDVDVAYRQDERFVREFFEFNDFARLEALYKDQALAGFREQGVYLITGGMGALGLLVAKYLIEKYHARVYLTGRSGANREKLAGLQALVAKGGYVDYIQGDVSNFESVQQMIAKINVAGDQLNGIIHSAGLIEDNFILRKEFSAFQRVIAPKLKGTVYLDLASKEQPLDVFVLFSSVTGILGNLGQCDYGYGNSFEDYFSHYRNGLQAEGTRPGKAVAINWPYWKEGGMVLSDKEEEILRRNFGITPLENDNGLRALEFAIRYPIKQIAVLEGDQDKVRTVLGVQPTVLPKQQRINFSASQQAADIKDKALAFLVKTFSSELNLPEDRFDLNSTFQSYGFDSVVMIEMVDVLEKSFSGLPKTLFFEYQTLNDLTDYIAREYAQQFISVFAMHESGESQSEQEKYTASVSHARNRYFSTQDAAISADHGSQWNDDIVIVGVAGRYPEAENLAEYWNNLKEGRDCVREIPPERDWDVNDLFRPGSKAELGKSYAKWGGFLKNIDQFDPLFFSISPKEAEEMDPQERLFLETVFLAIADAGYRPDKLAAARGVRDNPVGVYVGVMWGDYHLYGLAGQTPSDIGVPHSFYWAVANRVSYHFNFSGPSLTIDTACSSSLSAIHLACAAIKRGEIDVGIAGGVNLSLHPLKYALLSHLRFLSSDGRCRSFGSGGDGYVPAEAVGAVILKRKADALRDGDHVYAIIKGTALNHGGKTSGFTVPNPNRQAALIKEALDSAKVNPRHISYVEAHGTGTSLGDPIEIAGLSKAFEQHERQYCALGSAKSNIGHAEAAAGIAGLSKILLQIKYKKIAPSLHSAELNAYAKIEQSPFYVQQALSDWQPPVVVDAATGAARQLPRIAALSSFGAGGANGHIIVEEYAEQVRHARAPYAGKLAILLSSRKEKSLRAMASELRAFIDVEPELAIVDLAYTLQVGRIPMDYGLAAIVSNVSELRDKLDCYLKQTPTAYLYSGMRMQKNVVGGIPNGTQIDTWLLDKDIDNLVQAWLKGSDIAWEKIYQSGEAYRISAPNYIFDKQRYWVDVPTKQKGVISSLHPLLDKNVSTLDEQLFEKSFSGGEFYLQDHRLGENAVLPGVAYLEMALQSAKLASNDTKAFGLSNIQWLKPIIVDAQTETIQTGLYVADSGVEFEIFKQQDENRILYARGQLLLEAFSPAYQVQDFAGKQETVDIEAVRLRCQVLPFEEVNRNFERLGFRFGPTFQVVQNLYFNDNEALGEIILSHDVNASAYILHPALLDGAVRTSIGIGGFVASQAGLPVPVALDKIVVHKPVVSSCLSYARLASGYSKNSLQTAYDIFVIDHEGHSIVSLYGFTVQRVVQIAMPKISREMVHAEKQAVMSVPLVMNHVAEPVMDYAKAVKTFLIKLVSQATKLAVQAIDTAAALENYGIDSVMILSMNEQLKEVFGDVPQTLFFEYQDIDGLTEYLAENHPEGMRALMSDEEMQLGQTTMKPSIQTVVDASPVQTADEIDPLKAARRFLSELLSSVTKLAAEQIELQTPLENYGVDSVMIVAMNERIEAVFGDAVSKTLFYEYTNLAEIAAYLVDDFRQVIVEKLMFAVAQQDGVVVIDKPVPDAATVAASSLTVTGIAQTNKSAPLSNRNSRRRFAQLLEQEEVAIIGLAGRYPMAESLDDFWRNIANGNDCIVEVPRDRWDFKKHYSKDRNEKGKVYSKWGSFLKGVDQFDAEFFGITPRDAEKLDPQERLFLQTCWECIEDAAYTRADLQKQVAGVFVGVMWGLYQHIDVSQEQLKYGRPSSSFSSVANRVSYTFGFNGPSIAMDSMCSSSLSSIHLACQSIRNGDCDVAIAGGVNLATHKRKYELLSQEQFLSTDGRCRAFGEGGDGYVPGEGVGAILLKPLSKARNDGDHIYATIKASAINHGGKTNGYTVPNQRAQTAVISKAIARAGWPAESLSYIEAHGTGTSLGDPIEIAGLTKALNGTSQQRLPENFKCYIGSIKANIGHLESAAGIAGVTKVLLQFKHKQIAPSIHSKVLNSNINFNITPLQVPQSLQDWRRPKMAGGEQVYPRRAGVSSFGAGGSNAHILLQEQMEMRPVTTELQKIPVMFLLSANSKERLRLYAQRLINYLLIQRSDDEHSNRLLLHRLSYTSQIGREAMSERLVVLVATLDDLQQALVIYVNGDVSEQIVTGSKETQSELKSIIDEDSKAALLDMAISKGQWQRLAKMWVSFIDIEWGKIKQFLYPQSASLGAAYLCRVSFPTSPFITRHCWVKEREENNYLASLHPFVDSNLSTLLEQRYSKTFSGDEFYLADHVIENSTRRIILPGVAYLEMARVCGDQAMDGLHCVRKIKNVLWIQPIEITDCAETINIRLMQGEHGIEYEVINSKNNEHIYSQGELLYASEDPFEDEWLDIEKLKQAAYSVDEKNDIYQEFKEMGFSYGPAYRVTEKRYRLDQAALSELELPEHLLDTHKHFVIHPSLMDAALRTGLAAGYADDGKITVPIVPFGLEELEIRHPMTKRCYAFASRVQSHAEEAVFTSINNDIKKYNIMITDDAGKVLLKLKNFMAKPLIKPHEQMHTAGLFKYSWVKSLLPQKAILLQSVKHVLCINAAQDVVQALNDQLPATVTQVNVQYGTRFSIENREQIEIARRDTDSYVQLFDYLKETQQLPDIVIFNALDEAAYEESEALNNINEQDVLAVHTSRSLNALMLLFKAYETLVPGRHYKFIYTFKDRSGLAPLFDQCVSGFSKSLLSVNHRFEMQTVDYSPEMSAHAIADMLLQEMAVAENISGREIRYHHDGRMERHLLPLAVAEAKKDTVYIKQRGVYLISGGLGKLGMLFAAYLAEHYQASLVLTGRSKLQPAAEQALADLRALGARVQYVPLDICNREQVRALIEKTVNDYGLLSGVLHCAGVADGHSILEHDLASFNRVLEPKIAGTHVLDQETRKQPLDFFILFSSISALVGDLGSGSYACANRFMDAYANYRSKLVAENDRYGASISINWPLWLQGGMEIPEEDRAFFNFSGIQPLTQVQGLHAFTQILAMQENQVFVASGNHEKMSRYLKIQSTANKASIRSIEIIPEQPGKQVKVAQLSTQSAPVVRAQKMIAPARDMRDSAGNAQTKKAVLAYVCEKLADIINMPIDDIDINASFERFGMDSVMLMEMQNVLKKDFERLSKTVLFEYDSVSKLTAYLMQTHADLIIVKFNIEQTSDKAAVIHPVNERPSPSGNEKQLFTLPTVNKFNKSASLKQLAQEGIASRVDEGIAVIGMAGKYPKAKDLADFWSNIINASETIETVPEARWDADRYYSNEIGRQSNTISSKWGSFIDDVDLFDPSFFRMSNDEASRLDPQVKVTLETAWQALEDAGYTVSSINPSSVGVFIGTMNDDFTRVTHDLYRDTNEYVGPGYVASEIANRISLIMNLNGPSFTVQTACSSSLTALHLARSALINSECDYAFAGGVNLSLHHGKYLMLQEMKVLSPSGKERTFDEAANGLVPSEGVGIVLLKKYSQAIADGDHIYGVIKSSSLSHSGIGPGQYLPSIRVMQETAKRAIDKAGVPVEDIGYVECHGTGTELGDPIELKSLENAFKSYTDQRQFCSLGTKANFGHMEAASGVCSLMKVLLCMQHEMLAPCFNLETVNLSFDPENSAFRFPTQALAWPRNARNKLTAGINSFGMGGSNAFMLVESHEQESDTATAMHGGDAPNKSVAILFSAESDEQLREYVSKYIEYFTADKFKSFAHTNTNIVDIAYTTQVGRAAYAYRLGIVADTLEGFIKNARIFLDGGMDKSPMIYSGNSKDERTRLVTNLLASQEGESFTETLLSAAVIDKLVSIWVCGAHVDWHKLYQGHYPKRVSLPGYPFKRIDTHISHYSLIGNKIEKRQVNELSSNKSVANGEDCHDGFNYQAGVWFEKERSNIKDLVVGSDVEIAKQLFANDDWKKQYWVEILNSTSDDYLFKGCEKGKVDVSAYQASEIKLSDSTYIALQRFTQQYGIELNTILVGAWALLLSRLNKTKYAQFGCLDRSISSAIQPYKVKVVGRQNVLKWLDNLQTERLIKYEADSELSSVLSEVSVLGDLWDSIIQVAQSEAVVSIMQIPGGLQKNAFVQLCMIVDKQSLTLRLHYLNDTIHDKSPADILEYLVGFIEGMVRNPDRNPVALPMQTKKEYRQKFWQGLEDRKGIKQ